MCWALIEKLMGPRAGNDKNKRDLVVSTALAWSFERGNAEHMVGSSRGCTQPGVLLCRLELAPMLHACQSAWRPHQACCSALSLWWLQYKGYSCTSSLPL